MATTQLSRDKLGEESQVQQEYFVARDYQGALLSNEQNYIVGDSKVGKMYCFIRATAIARSDNEDQ